MNFSHPSTHNRYLLVTCLWAFPDLQWAKVIIDSLMESLPSIDCFKEDLLLNALFSGGRPKSPRGFKNSRIFSPQGAFVLNYSSTTIDFSQAHLYAALHVLKCPILLKYAYFSPSIPNQPFVLLLNRVAIRIVFSRFMFNVDLHFYTPKI